MAARAPTKVEFLFSLVKSIVMLPLVALFEAPFLRLSARVVTSNRLTFGATYMLALIIGAVSIAAGLVMWPISAHLGSRAEAVVSLAAAFSIGGWLCGYFVTTPDGRSAGFAKGVLVVLLASFLFAVALLALTLAVIGVAHVWEA